MKRNYFLLTMLVFLIIFQSCQSLPEREFAASEEFPIAEVPKGAVSSGFEIMEFGELIDAPHLIISESASLLGSNLQEGKEYSQFFRLDPSIYKFDPDGVYSLNFSYRIVDTPIDSQKGFEVVMFSRMAMNQDKWVPSLEFSGPVGKIDTKNFTFSLYDFPDYELIWNVISTGSVVIDDIEIFDQNGNLFASESFERPSLRSAQAFLPTARVGQSYSCTPAVYGEGEQPIILLRVENNLPKGLQIDREGHIEGVPEEKGEYLLHFAYADKAGLISRLMFRLQIVAQEEVSDYSITGKLIGDSNLVAYTYEPYTKAFRNPLKGMRPYAESATNHPWATLGRKYVEWNLIERNTYDTVERIKSVTNSLAGDLPSYNIKLVPRVYLHWPPDRNYWPEDLKNGDYYSKEFKERLLNLIHKLGEAWDNDPKIAYIEMGIVGQWGEHHDPGFGNLGFEEAKPVTFERAFAEAFTQAFSNKLLMRRYPRDFIGYRVGIYWDVFGSKGDGFWGNDTEPMTNELQKPEHFDSWKTSPRGGEIDPTFLQYPSWDIKYFNQLVKEQSERLVGIIKNLHWNHLAVLEYVDPHDEKLWEKGSTIQNALGYTFIINKAVLPTQIWRSKLTISLNISNTGSSPFYYDWPLEITLLDPLTHQPVWKADWLGLDIRTWMVDQSYTIESTFDVPHLPNGEYIVAVSILDPAGRVPAARFANINYFNGGYTPLGVVGVGKKPATFILSGFDDLSIDRSLYYLPSNKYK